MTQLSCVIMFLLILIPGLDPVFQRDDGLYYFILHIVFFVISIFCHSGESQNLGNFDSIPWIPFFWQDDGLYSLFFTNCLPILQRDDGFTNFPVFSTVLCKSCLKFVVVAFFYCCELFRLCQSVDSSKSSQVTHPIVYVFNDIHG